MKYVQPVKSEMTDVREYTDKYWKCCYVFILLWLNNQYNISVVSYIYNCLEQNYVKKWVDKNEILIIKVEWSYGEGWLMSGKINSQA